VQIETGLRSPSPENGKYFKESPKTFDDFGLIGQIGSLETTCRIAKARHWRALAIFSSRISNTQIGQAGHAVLIVPVSKEIPSYTATS
jgi:hypothetical protein